MDTLRDKLARRAELTRQLAELNRQLAELNQQLVELDNDINTIIPPENNEITTSAPPENSRCAVVHNISRIFRHRLSCREQALLCQTRHDFVS